jgi:two-component system, chemotaxis family, protein-glutamate methylesterase/glutaminase
MNLAVAASPKTEQKIRILHIDDSVVIRGIVGRWLGEDPIFEIVATASNGKMGIDMLERAAPHIVLLDIEMPEMDGITALPEILKRRPNTAVVMCSTLTRRNADISLKCMSLGATDYIPKPESREAALSNAFKADLFQKLRMIGQRAQRLQAPKLGLTTAAASTSHKLAPMPPMMGKRLTIMPKCLAIGSSTGGPKAVATVLKNLSSIAKKVPIIIVQHMPPLFTTVFAEHLQAETGIPACEPKEGDRFEPGKIYVAAGGKHLNLVKSAGGAIVAHLSDGAPVNFCKPAVDVMFQDAAKIYGNSVLGVVLTGMGSDGMVGAGDMVKAGACVIAQDEATSTVWGMPGAVTKAGFAHQVLPLDSIAASIRTLMGEM